jgi:hypothetical protein
MENVTFLRHKNAVMRYTDDVFSYRYGVYQVNVLSFNLFCENTKKNTSDK